MKITSWNVNGLRATYKQGYFETFLKKEKSDIICLQETKVEFIQLPVELQKLLGYNAYFSHSKGRKGYSGVAIYSKIEPKKVEYGIGIKKFDDEGRIVIAYYEEFTLLNIYFPNGGSGPDRLAYKLEFYDEFLKFINKLRKKGQKVVFCGDVNTAHEAIDLARPKANEENTGFLPIERAWIDEVIAESYIDIYRHFYPNKKDVYTYWDMKTRARDRNVGWRIDYFFTSADFVQKIKSIKVSDQIFGSDHCPISIDVDLSN